MKMYSKSSSWITLILLFDVLVLAETGCVSARKEPTVQVDAARNPNASDREKKTYTIMDYRIPSPQHVGILLTEAAQRLAAGWSSFETVEAKSLAATTPAQPVAQSDRSTAGGEVP